MKRKMLLIVLSLVCALTCAFGLAACDDGTTDGSGNGGTDNNGGTQTVAVESVTLDETTLTMDIGDEETLTATVAPDNATNKTVTWSSSNNTVATVANGKVTAVAAGTATITATADGKNATCAVTVNSATPSTITGTYYMIETSETGWQPNTQHAFVFNSDGTCDTEVAGTYTIENGIITIVSADDNYPMTIYATIDGNIMWLFQNKDDTTDFKKSVQPLYSKTEITPADLEKIIELYGDGETGGKDEDKEYPNENGNNGTQTVAVESVTLNKTELTLEVGGEETLTATVTPDNATDKTVTWSSDNTAVATVENGKITAVAAGNATITAKAGDKTAACIVTVNAATADTSVGGKAFIFETLTCEGMDENTLQTTIAMINGTTIEFNSDGTFTVEQPALSVVEKGTYTQDSQSITITITEMTLNGEPQTVPDGGVIAQCTFDGEQLIMVSQSVDQTIYSTFVLQTAE